MVELCSFDTMNLAVDAGNSKVKTGLFVKNKLVKANSYDNFNLQTLKSIFKENPDINSSILCSVREYPKIWEQFLADNSRFVKLEPGVPVPVKTTYKTPETLGMDRLAAVCGACAIYKKGNILVVNAGTCIVYDFIDSRKVYRGGAISPGIDMRYKALHTFTGRLPLIAPDMEFKKLTGENTAECIVSGVQAGIVQEIDGIIKEYRAAHKNLTILLTGGAAPWLLKSLKSKIKSEPFLVLTGLNVILSLFHNQGNHIS